MAHRPRWTLSQVTELFEKPLLDLLFEAQQVHAVWLKLIFFKRYNIINPRNISLMFNNFILFFIIVVKLIKI